MQDWHEFLQQNNGKIDSKDLLKLREACYKGKLIEGAK